jgi:hypothetical protein
MKEDAMAGIYYKLCGAIDYRVERATVRKGACHLMSTNELQYET